MFGLLLHIVDRLENGNTGLAPGEIRRLLELKPIDTADIVVRLSRMKCVEIKDTTNNDVEVMLSLVAESDALNAKFYFAVRALLILHPILYSKEWRNLAVSLSK